MKNILRNLFRILSYTSAILALTPYVVFLGGCFRYSYTNQMNLLFATVLIGFIPIILGHIVYDKLNIPRLAQNMILGVVTILSILFAYRLMKGYSWLEYLIWMIFLLVVFIRGYTLSEREYSKIISETAFYNISATFLVGVFLCYLCNFPLSIWQYTLTYLFITIVFAVVKNYNNIQTLMERRKFSEDFLPPRILAYNNQLLLIVLGILIGFTALLYPLKSITIKLGHWVKHITISTFDFIFNLDIFSSTPLESTPPNNEESLIDVGGIATTTTFKIALVVGIIIFVILLFFVTGKLLNYLTKNAFIYKYKNIFHKYDKVNDEYIDIEEAIVELNSIPKITKRQLKKQYRAFSAMENSFSKYQFGYALTLKSLTFLGVPIHSSNTPLEIVRKAKEFFSLHSLDDATSIYNVFYYGLEQYTSNSIVVMDQALTAILKQL